MADSKYGRVFTQGDVEKILEWVQAHDDDITLTLSDVLDDMQDGGVRFKFDADEPLFILRGRDRRAIGAIRFYQDHQASNVPESHANCIASDMSAFDRYRNDHAEKMREPD